MRVMRGVVLAPWVVGISMLHGLWVGIQFVLVVGLPLCLMRSCAGV